MDKQRVNSFKPQLKSQTHIGIAVQVPKKMDTRLKFLAHKARVSKSELVRQMLEFCLEQQNC